MDSNFQFLVASPSEGDGTQVSKMRADLSRNRRFESISLQQGVTCELDFGHDAVAPSPPTSLLPEPATGPKPAPPAKARP
jgi:hypothetical protein